MLSQTPIMNTFPPQLLLRVRWLCRRTCPIWECPSLTGLSWSAATTPVGSQWNTPGSRVLKLPRKASVRLLWIFQNMFLRDSKLNLGAAPWPFAQSSWMTLGCTSAGWTAVTSGSSLMAPTCRSSVSVCTSVCQRWSQVSSKHLINHIFS